MSLQAVLARISEIQGAMAPVQPTQPATPAAPATSTPGGSESFAGQLQTAMAGTGGTGTVDPSSAASASGALGKQAAPGTYPHLDGDLDASPEILAKLEALAAKKGMHFHINSGYRSIEEQQRLWDNRASNPLPVAQPGKSRHQSGRACDVSIGGRPIQSVISAAEIRAAGLVPLAGDAPHVELP
jgi:hypothetical protein